MNHQSQETQESRCRAAQALRSARSIVCLTGAGVSAESGIPTFRDAQTGLWANFDPEVLASIDGFRRDPALVWRWYMDRFGKLCDAQPNPGHIALAGLEEWCVSAAGGREPARFDLFTQNIDSLHEQAGSISLFHLHGRIDRYRCDSCGLPWEMPEGGEVADEPPRCSVCGGLIRPGVVWFGEALPAGTLGKAFDRTAVCDLMLVVGTSGQVFPVAQMPYEARQAGACIIDVNPEDSPISQLADIRLKGPGAVELPAVMEILEASAGC